MIFFTLLVFSLYFSQPADARNLVLLTSLPPSQVKLEAKLEKLFLKKTLDFKDEFNFIIEHKADQEVLHQYLNDPETMALFWVSHGAYAKFKSSGAMKATPFLLDHQKDNVAKVFEKVNPNVKYLGIIGCNTQQILENILKERSDLDYYVPNKKVIAQSALKRSIKNFRYTHARKDNSLIVTKPVPAEQISIKRKTGDRPYPYKSLKVIVGKDLITVLPKMKPNSEQTFQIHIPQKDHYSKRELKIVFESGQSPFDETDYFGQLVIEHKGEEKWKLFSRRDGKPFGTNERIFNFNNYRGGKL